MDKKNNSQAGGSKITTETETIKKWVEERGGKPAIVASTKKNGSGLLRIKFQGNKDNLEEISWEEFFKIFEESKLALLYQEKTKDGEMSRFFKLVKR